MPANAPASATNPRKRGDLSGSRRLDVQGLRALAIIAVLVFHAGLALPGGFTGVDVFFVISGYVITAMLLREWLVSGTIRLGAFYLRRFKRLVPALALVVAVTTALSIVFLPPLGEENRVLITAIGALTFSANFVIDIISGDYFALRAQSNPLLHTWSLSVEEQFYLIFPAFLLLGLVVAGRRIGWRAGATVLVGLATLGSFALSVAGDRLPLPYTDLLLSFYSPVTRAWEFGVGALVALLSPVLSRLGQWSAGAVGILGALAVSLGFVVISKEVVFPGWWALLPVLGTAAMITAGSAQPTNPVSKFLSIRPMTVIGDWSYSLYLWHWPFVVFAHLTWQGSLVASIAATIVSIIPALVSYYRLEQPLRTMSTPTRIEVTRLVAAVMIPPALVLVGKNWVTVESVQPALYERIGNPIEISIANERECMIKEDFSAEWVDRCTFGGHYPGRPIVLIGDSNATHFDQPLVAAGSALARPVSILTSPACFPFANFRVEQPGGDNEKPWCDDYVDFVLDHLEGYEEATVVFAFSDFMAWESDRYYKFGEAPATVDPYEKAEVVGLALEYTLRVVAAQGHDTLVIPAIPSPRIVGYPWSPQECNIAELFLGACALDLPRTDVEAKQDPTREATFLAAARAGAGVLDFREELCDETYCYTDVGDFIIYRDDHHLSAAGASRFTENFIQSLGD